MSQMHSVDELQFDIYDRLRKSMRVADKSSSDIARDLGVHRNTIANVLAGRVPLERRTLLAWAMATSVSVEWLETGHAPSDPDDGGGVVNKRYPLTLATAS